MPHQEHIHADKLGVSNQQIKRGIGIRPTVQYRDHTTDRLGVMTQKAEKMLLNKIINE